MLNKKKLAQKSKIAFDKGLAAERKLSVEYREVYRIILKDYFAIVGVYKKPTGEYDFLKLKEDLRKNPTNNKETRLLLKIDELANKLIGRETKLVEEVMVDVFKENSSRLFYEIQKKVGYELELFDLSDATVKQLVQAKWTSDGRNYVDRISRGNTKMANNLKNIVTDGVTKGQDPRKTANQLRDVTNSKLSSAKTLVRTETNAMITQSDHMTYEKLGFEEYEFNAEYDDRTTDVCGDLDGQRFLMSEMTIGVNAPPMHPNCRSTIEPVNIINYKPDYKYGKDGVGRPVKIDSDMSYQDFKKQYL